MLKLLLQLDSSRLPSVFDQVVAYDAGADRLLSKGGVTEAEVRDLVHGCIFTRSPKDMKNTAIFIGGADMAAGEKLLVAATKAFFANFRVSTMLDSNGSNTTAVAAVVKITQGTRRQREGKEDRRHRGYGPGGHARGGTVREGRRRRHHHLAQARGWRARVEGDLRSLRRHGEVGAAARGVAGSGRGRRAPRCCSTPAPRA